MTHESESESSDEWGEARDIARLKVAHVLQDETMNYDDRRKTLRAMAMPVLEAHLSPLLLETILKASPLVGDGSDQVSMRLTHAGLRDQLSETALASIAARVPLCITEMVQALLDPDHHAATSSRGKTGYSFGENKEHYGNKKLVKWCRQALEEAERLMKGGPAHGPSGPVIDLHDLLKTHKIGTGSVASKQGVMIVVDDDGTAYEEAEDGGHPVPVKTGSTGSSTTTTTTTAGGLETSSTHTKKEDETMTKQDLNIASVNMDDLIAMAPKTSDVNEMHSSELVVLLCAIAQKMGGREMLAEAGRVVAACTSETQRERITDGILPYALGQEEDDLVDMKPDAADIVEALRKNDTEGMQTLLDSALSVVDQLTKLAHGEVSSAGAGGAVKPLLSVPSGTEAELMNMVLAKAGMPSIDKIVSMVNTEHGKVAGAMAKAETAERKLAEMLRKMHDEKTAIPKKGTHKGDGTIPNGKFELVPACDAFGLTKAREMFSFEVPKWTWDGVHPLVPEVNPDYVFRPKELFTLLMGLVSNDPTYLHGHTGTGKTTLVEQVAAVLGYPFMRLNFDSEISRMDLIGRDTLVSDGKTTVSKFVDGIVPQMMQTPCLACFDEIDFVRADVSYVLQRVLENDALLLTEDGGRVVHPHPMFRIFATGNTTGQGDEFGMYQGARPQSLALLDRFTNWIQVDYLPHNERMGLIKKAAPGLKSKWQEAIGKYVTEHLTAFKDAKVLQPLSPRGYQALAKHCAKFVEFYPASREVEAVKDAFDATVLARATSQDRAVMRGLMDRVVK